MSKCIQKEAPSNSTIVLNVKNPMIFVGFNVNITYIQSMHFISVYLKLQNKQMITKFSANVFPVEQINGPIDIFEGTYGNVVQCTPEPAIQYHL